MAFRLSTRNQEHCRARPEGRGMAPKNPVSLIELRIGIIGNRCLVYSSSSAIPTEFSRAAIDFVLSVVEDT